MNYREQINKLLDKQDAKGLRKYGVSLEQNPAGILERLQHSVEEQADNLRYTLWAMDALEKQWWRFPKTKFAESNDLERQLDHVRSERVEMWTAFMTGKIGHLCEELFDVIHSCETALWLIKKQFPEIDMPSAMQAVERKNFNRGYYNVGTKGAEKCLRNESKGHLRQQLKDMVPK
ncbi:MAG: hypothetical protein M0P69_14950 [Bacteroidales bacterium]|nr:hypothetical protein [Bacteroidales bacterium]